MKPRCILAFLCLTCAAALACAGTPKRVDIPADDLTDAVELLAKQYEVDVIYPSDLLRDRQTPGLSGAFEAMDAFKKLLEGTSLVLSREGGALLITQPTQPSRPPQQATARDADDDELAEVLIKAQRAPADAADQPTQKRDPIFGWARHNAARQAALAYAQTRNSTCERLAKKGDVKIQVYCTVQANPHRPRSVRTARAPDTPSGGTSCRRLIKSGSNRIQSFCGDRALWDEFDTWAVHAGVTCRFAEASQELCLTAAQWAAFDRPLEDSAAEPTWPGEPAHPAPARSDGSAALYRPTDPDRVTARW